jgi:hypothetical protein
MAVMNSLRVLTLRRAHPIHAVVLQAREACRVQEEHKEQQGTRVHKDSKVYQEQIPIQVPQEPRDTQVQQDHRESQVLKVFQVAQWILEPQEPRE